jgi:hypothetical protein
MRRTIATLRRVVKGDLAIQFVPSGRAARASTREPAAADPAGNDAERGCRRQHGAREPLPERRPPEPREPRQVGKRGTRIAHAQVRERVVAVRAPY